MRLFIRRTTTSLNKYDGNINAAIHGRFTKIHTFMRFINRLHQNTCWQRLSWLIVIAIVATFFLTDCTQSAISQSAESTARDLIAQQRASSVDCGDYYATPQGEQKLYRLAGAVAVRFEDDADKEAVLDDLTALDGLLSEYTFKLNDYGQIAMLKTRPVAESQKLMQAMAVTDVVETVRHVPGLVSASPVFIDPDTGFWMIPTGDIIVQLKQNAQPETVFGDREIHRPPATTSQFLLTLRGAASDDIFAEVDLLLTTVGVEWAEPDFLSQGILCALNDEYYSQQWHLNNTGQGGGNRDADVGAPEAWTTTTGNPNIVIAVLDIGVQTDHPDLRQNLFINSGDSDDDGIDDDNNDYIDDINGWDFFTNWNWPNWPNTPLPSYTNGNKDPNPKTNFDNHGTGVSGVAVARGNNGIGVAGVAYTSKLLPIRIGQSEDASGTFSSYDSGIAAAIRYAAGIDNHGNTLWRGADILNMSITRKTPSIDIERALHDAATKGRNGKGCVIFCSSGNNASGHHPYGVNTSDLAPGRYSVLFVYSKDLQGKTGDDRAWIADVILPDQTHTRERFSSGSIPSGWSTWGDADFDIVDDPAHAYGTGRYIARSGRIGNSQNSILQTRSFTLVPGNYLLFEAWVSSEKGTDEIRNISYPPDGDDGDWLFVFFCKQGEEMCNWWAIDAGVPGDRRGISGKPLDPQVGYPASHPDTVAVGSSTNFDYRAHYSQYGTELDFLAPGGDGLADIWTTDRTGAAGYARDGDYAALRGTSFASPLAAGVAALMLSKNPNLTAQQVRDIMRRTCDKVGSASYDSNGWIQYYGYGRINAQAALEETPSLNPSISGHVRTSNGSGVSGVTVSANNNGGSDTTDSDGYYSLTVPQGWSGRVRPSKENCSFSPPSKSYQAITSNVTGQDFIATLQLILGHCYIGGNNSSVRRTGDPWTFGTYTQEGFGLHGASDRCHFAYTNLSGDGYIQALVSIDGPYVPYPDSPSMCEAGVMIRETLDADSKHAATILTCSSEGDSPISAFCWRRQTRRESEGAYGSENTHSWIKVVRDGHFLKSYSSQNGVHWTQIGNWVYIPMKENVFIGLALTASTDNYTEAYEHTSQEWECTFENVEVVEGL